MTNKFTYTGSEEKIVIPGYERESYYGDEKKGLYMKGMNFNKFIEKTELEIKRFIKHEEFFDMEKASEEDEGEFFTAMYFVRSNVTSNIFVVRYYYDVETDEFQENYIVLSEENSEKFVNFFNSEFNI